MANLYEFINRFQLVDVNGTILTNPGDAIIIREPENFRDVRITLERSDQYHGFNYEFSDLSLGFSRNLVTGEANNAYDFLQAIYNADGVDARVRFELYNATVQMPNGFAIQFAAHLQFDTMSLTDKFIFLQTKRVALDDLFQSRVETNVNFAATTTIEGTLITPPTGSDTFLHSKEIVLGQRATSSISRGSFFDTTTDWLMQFDGTSESNGNDGILSGYNNAFANKYGAGSFTNITFEQGLNPDYILNDIGGSLTGSRRVSYTLLISGAPNVSATHVGSYVRINDEEIQLDADGTAYPAANPLTAVVDQFFTIDIFIPRGASVYFYDRWTINNINTANHTWTVLPGGTNDDNINVTFNGFNLGSTATTYAPFDSFQHILRVITDTTTPLISDFFTNTADDIRLTNGYRIRNLSTRNVITSFEELFDNWAQPIFGLGYAVVSVAGIPRVLIERYDHFYANAEITAITTVDNDSWEETIDSDIIFNEIDIGYRDFPKSTDENTSNNIDEFNTVQHLLTPISSVKNKATYISNVIASGYKIENQRIEQFADVPADTVTDDDKIFCINTENTTQIVTASGDGFEFDPAENTIFLERFYHPILPGDSITISGSSSHDGAYTVNRIFHGEDSVVPPNFGMYLEVNSVGGGLEIGTASLTIDIPDRLTALRDQEFVTLSGVTSPTTIYNGGLNPKNMLANQSLIINSGLNRKAGTDTIKTQEVLLNGAMTSRFDVGEGGYVLDPNRETVTQEDDVILNDLNNFNKLFTGNLLKFTTSIGYDTLQTIRDACLREGPFGVWFGYITVTDPFGITRTGWIKTLTYNPLDEQTEFVLRERFT